MKMTFVLVALLAITSLAQAQTPAAVSNMFAIPEACIANIGKVPFYEPNYLKGCEKEKPVDGKSTIAAPLEGDACVHMRTMRNWQWVPLRDDTILRWRVAADATKTPYAHDKCCNDVDGIRYPPSPPAPTTPPPASTPPTAAPVAPSVPREPLKIDVNVSGTVNHIHSGKVDVNHSGEVRNVEPPKKRWCGKKCWIIGGIAAGATTGGIVYAAKNPHQPTQRSSGQNGAAF